MIPRVGLFKVTNIFANKKHVSPLGFQIKITYQHNLMTTIWL